MATNKTTTDSDKVAEALATSELERAGMKARIHELEAENAELQRRLSMATAPGQGDPRDHSYKGRIARARRA